MAEKFEMVIAIVNRGFSEEVMDAARAEGARGGTIINARGTGTPELEKKYGISITPEKEMLMILVSADIVDNVLSAIYKRTGMASNGQGIVFSVPVSDVVGIKAA